MKILHTADWHIGQLFYEFDRTIEHQQFLNWLVQTLSDEQINVLLISGDVFDLSNPSASSIKMFYTFLNQATKANPGLQIIITAGNHDSASRLESPKPLLESSNIHIIGLIERKADGQIDFEKLIIPIKDVTETIIIWCLAIPFLRMGDYPVVPGSENPYSDGVTAFYKEVFDYSLSKKSDGQVIIAMGHLHALNAEITDLDKTERSIMGGLEFIPTSAFHEDIKYVALGHIHKGQKIGGKEYVRYSGSPIPMSFSELNYKHQVVVFEVTDGSISDLHSIEVPVVVPLLRTPLTHRPLNDVLFELEQLPSSDVELDISPFLEVRVLLREPEPGLRHKVETALTGKKIRLAKIDVKYPAPTSSEESQELISQDKLHELKPLDVFLKTFQTKYNTAVPEDIMRLFNEVEQEVNLKEN